MRDTESAPETLRRGLQALLAGQNTAGPGLVKAVSGSGQNITLDVVPMIGRWDNEGNPKPFATLFSVPLFPLAVGGWTIDITPAIGDIVTLIWCDRSLDEWKQDKKEVVPTANRNKALSDAMAFPFGFSSGSSASITIGPVGGGSPSIEISTTSVTVDGNLNVTGTVKGGTLTPATTVTLNTHTHPAGTPNTGVPNPG